MKAHQFRCFSQKLELKKTQKNADMECFLCHENPSSGENLESHIKSYHGVKYDFDLLLALQVMTKEEKCSLLKQMEERLIKKVIKVEDNPKPVDDSVATKIRFWKGKVASTKEAVKELDGQNFSRKDGASNEKALNKLLKQTLSEHLLGQKSADDTIEVFEEIFATTCAPDFDEDFVEETFRLLLDNDLSEEADKVSEDLVAVPRRTRVLQETRKSVFITAGKNLSSKFLTYLKGHMNSKVGCKLKKKQGPLFSRPYLLLRPDSCMTIYKFI